MGGEEGRGCRVEDAAGGQMSSSVCRGGIDTTVAVFDHDGSGVGNGHAFQPDSIRREMAPRCFLRWYDC